MNEVKATMRGALCDMHAPKTPDGGTFVTTLEWYDFIGLMDLHWPTNLNSWWSVAQETRMWLIRHWALHSNPPSFITSTKTIHPLALSIKGLFAKTKNDSCTHALSCWSQAQMESERGSKRYIRQRLRWALGFAREYLSTHWQKGGKRWQLRGCFRSFIHLDA